MRWRPVIDFLAYAVVRVFVCVLQALRMETGQRIAQFLAWLAADVLRIRRHVLDDNLSHAFPDLSPAERQRLVRRMWEHLLLMLFEIAHTPRKIHETNWRDFITLRGEKELVRLLLDDRPVIITTAHFGNFETAGVILGVLGFPSHTVARTLDNPYLDRFVNRFRGSTGQYIIPKNGGYEQILAVLGSGGTMTFLADQYAGPKGCWVEFFGRPASAHKAIGLLAMENNAPVAVSFSRRLDRPMRFELVVTATADPLRPGPEFGSVKALTQWYTAQIEQIIRVAPEQYWWLHRRWKDTRQRRAKLPQAA